jgi:hypothetical protein
MVTNNELDEIVELLSAAYMEKKRGSKQKADEYIKEAIKKARNHDPKHDKQIAQYFERFGKELIKEGKTNEGMQCYIIAKEMSWRKESEDKNTNNHDLEMLIQAVKRNYKNTKNPPIYTGKVYKYMGRKYNHTHQMLK